jgi:hypothetical protein
LIIIETVSVPQKAVAKAEVRDSEETRLEALHEWARDNLRGTLWWRATQFRDPKDPRMQLNSRQRRFAGGYLVYTFWFSRKADAAKFIMLWGLNGSR